jgi:hypothetical protein
MEEGKEGDQKQDGKKAHLELWKKVVYEMELVGQTSGDWVSKDVAMHLRTTTYIHACIQLDSNISIGKRTAILSNCETAMIMGLKQVERSSSLL